LVDITASTGIHFEHLSSPEAKYIAESMSGGVALIDYDRDGWPDIYFTNAQSVQMAQHGVKLEAPCFITIMTDVHGCHRQGRGRVSLLGDGRGCGDYNNDGWPDLLVTCMGGVVFYRNNGDGNLYRCDQGK